MNMSVTDDVVGIMVTRPVYDQFHTLLLATQTTTDELMNHFFQLHNKNEAESECTPSKSLSRGENFSRLTVNIPKNVLRRDILVNVALPGQTTGETTDGDNTSEDPEEEMVLQEGNIASLNETSTVGTNLEKRDPILKCRFCSFKTNGKKKFKKHLLHHEKGSLKCSQCSLTFVDETQMKLHIQHYHGNDPEELSMIMSRQSNSHSAGHQEISYNEKYKVIQNGNLTATAQVFDGRGSFPCKSQTKKLLDCKCPCGIKFSSKSRLLHHKKLCKGSRRYANKIKDKIGGLCHKRQEIQSKVRKHRSEEPHFVPRETSEGSYLKGLQGNGHVTSTADGSQRPGSYEYSTSVTKFRETNKPDTINDENHRTSLEDEAISLNNYHGNQQSNDIEQNNKKQENTISLSDVEQNEADLLLSFSRSINQPAPNHIGNPLHEVTGPCENDNGTEMYIGQFKENQSNALVFKPGSSHNEVFQIAKDSESFMESGLDVKQENMELEEPSAQTSAVEMTEEEKFFMNFAQEVSRRYAQENPNFANFYMGKNSVGSFQDEGEGTLKCEECGEIFKRKAYLKEHIEGKHGGGLRYSCDCGKKFKWRSSLGNHRKNCQMACSNDGQSVSVIDFSQYNPYLGMENNWASEIERLKQSVLFAKKTEMNSSTDVGVSDITSDRNSVMQVPKATEQRMTDQSRQESVTSQNPLRIDSSLVKPFADALSKYQQKQPTLCQNLSGKGLPDGVERGKAVIDLTTDSRNKPPVTNITSTENIHSKVRQEEISHNGRKSSQSEVDSVKDGVQCSFCNESFSHKSELERHKLFCKHLQDTCSVCGQRFQQRKDLVNHLLTFHGNDESYNCFCGFQSSTWTLFEKHCEKCEDFKKKSASLLSFDKNFSQFGNKSPSQIGSLGIQNKQRMRRHSDMSDMRLSSDNDLNTKIAFLHHGLTKAPCDLASSFMSQYSSQHTVSSTVQSHDQQCIALPTFSSFVSSASSLLNNTTLSVSSVASSNQNSTLGLTKPPSEQRRIPENENKKEIFVCSYCGNVFNDIQKFSEHNKFHLSKKFSNNNQTNVHKGAVDMAINKSQQHLTRGAEHVCHLCGDVFAAKAYLKEHIGGKHGTVDRYKCPCGMRFKWRSSLGIHQRKCPKASRRTYNRWNSS